jgi:methylmalonyl-CoA mutase cobalamin-binding subunit
MADIDYSLLGRLGAFTQHSRYSAKESTRPARAAFLASLERQVDPLGVLDPDDRAARTAAALRVHMIRMSMASREIRKQRSAARRSSR